MQLSKTRWSMQRPGPIGCGQGPMAGGKGGGDDRERRQTGVRINQDLSLRNGSAAEREPFAMPWC
jgi:hypothetical protein